MELRYNRVQQRMADVLADGMPHTRLELHGCLYDELGKPSNVYSHICGMRKQLLKMGQTIVCEYRYRSFYYRQVRLLASACDGKV